MNDNLFYKEKDIFNEIDVPKDLDHLINSSMKSGGQKFINRKIKKGIKVVALLLISFIGVINISPEVANALEGVPVLGVVSKAVKFDWVEKSYDKGAYSKGVYKETIDGITLEIKEMVGDKENLRFEYEIKSKNKFDRIHLSPYPSSELNKINYQEEYDKVTEEMTVIMDEYIRIVDVENRDTEKYFNILKEKAEKRERMLEIEEEIHNEQLAYLEEEKGYINKLENHRYFVNGISAYGSYSKEKEGEDEANYFYISLDDNEYYSNKEGNKIEFSTFVNNIKGEEAKETEFKIELDLPQEVVDKFEKKVAINKIFKTHFGEIEIIDATSNITGTKITSKIKEENQYIRSFINPRLITESGEEIRLSHYYEGTLNDWRLNELSFDYSFENEKVIFKADGVRYNDSFEKRIAIYPKKKFMKANNYGGELLSLEGNRTEVRLLNIKALELTFDDENLKLTNKEVKTVDGKEYIYLTFEILDLEEDIVFFGTEVKVEYTPIEIEIDFNK